MDFDCFNSIKTIAYGEDSEEYLIIYQTTRALCLQLTKRINYKKNSGMLFARQIRLTLLFDNRGIRVTLRVHRLILWNTSYIYFGSQQLFFLLFCLC